MSSLMRCLREGARYGTSVVAPGRYLLIASLILSGSAPAIAANGTSGGSSGESANMGTIQVTGTRIRRASYETSQPVLRISREQLQATGLANVGDILRKITSAGTPTNGGYSEGGTGEKRVDLRYLGSKRVLVLVDGHRWVKNNNAGGTGIGLTLGLQGAVDVSTIPLAIVDHIEVLQDGASAIYGSDAIAGVVNIITRKNFRGVRASAYYGFHKADGEAVDGQTQHYSATLGFGQSNGNMLFNVSYVKQNPIYERDRDISRYPINYPDKKIALTRVTTPGPYGYFDFMPNGFIPPNGCGGGTLQPNGHCDLTLKTGATPPITPGDFRNRTMYDQFNPNSIQYLLTPLERYQVYTQGHYDLNENVSVHVKALYNRRTSKSQFIPSSGRILNPAVNSSGGIPHSGTLTVSRTNPYNPFNMDFVLGDPGNPAVNAFTLGHQSPLVGQTNVNVDNRTFEFIGGLNGNFIVGGRLFNWDIDADFGKSTDFATVTGGEFYQDRMKYALGPISQCGPGTVHPDCVPLDIFGGPGSLTPEMLNYIQFAAHDNAGHTLRDYTANLSSSNIVALPGGSLGVAVGFEHRKLTGFVSSDPAVVNGNGTTNIVESYSGGYQVNAYYGEINIPLISDMPGARMLNLDLAARHSEYNTFGGNTSKRAGLKYQPIRDVLLRASVSTGFRSPGITEMFAADSVTFESLTDLCNSYTTSGVPAQVQNRCKAAGVPASYVQTTARFPIHEGGNSNLDPETSLSKTFGFVYSPSVLPGFDISADYYHIVVDNAVTQLDTGQVLRGCYEGGNQSLCQRIVRNPNGSLKTMRNSPVNLGSITTAGIDYSLSYQFPATSFGDFKLSIRGTNVREYKAVFPGLAAGGEPEVERYLGKQHSTLEPLSAVPHNKTNLNVYWTYGNWSANYTLRYISDFIGDCTDRFDGTELSLTNLGICSYPDYENNAQSKYHFGAVAYHDIAVSYFFPSAGTKVSLGVNNLFAKTPPGLGGTYGAYDTAVYDFPDRFVYFRIVAGI